MDRRRRLKRGISDVIPDDVFQLETERRFGTQRTLRRSLARLSVEERSSEKSTNFTLA